MSSGGDQRSERKTQETAAWAATQQFVQAGKVASRAGPAALSAVGGVAELDSEHDELIGAKLGHYRLRALIGQGGMGRVYRAVDERLQRDVALKVLPPDVAVQNEWRARLMREARAAAAITHRNIASVYDVGDDGEHVFIAMELVEGDTLRRKMAEGLTLAEAVDIATQIARGVARAHEKGVLHRDLKPDNVIVGVDGDVKILDFGLAKRMSSNDEPVSAAAALSARAPDDPSATQVGFVMGTPGYMSPEQILGEPLDERSDIFSLGVILYEMTTGVQPFRGTVDEVFRATIAKPPAAPTEMNPSISPELESVILHCLARWPSDRMASARALAADLELVPGAPRRWPSGLSLPVPDVQIRSTSATHSSVIAPSADLPRGTVTILCAFVAEAAQLHQRYGERYGDIIARYHAIVGGAAMKNAGFIADFTGEQAIAVFTDARRALQTAVEAQRAFVHEAWTDGASVRVRLGLHTGEPKLFGERYVGIEMHRAMRVGEAAPGGQVVLTAATRALLAASDLDGLSLRDLGPLRIKDLHYPEHLYEVSIDAHPEPKSVVRRMSGAWSKLPAQSTAFVGRKRQIADVITLLRRPDARIVTLTGLGGTGKTRLSIEVARAMQRDFDRGVVHVPLASVTDPELVPASIAQALDVSEVPGNPLLDVLKKSIGDSSVLLVLDNFEQIIDAAPTVAELCAACPGLKVLTTSREALKVSGEREHAVPPLDVLANEAEATLDDVASCEAAALFVERVRIVAPAFELTAETAPLVLAICARLEGIPLAIELAASRMKMLTLPALHKRLSDRLGFLKGTDRDRAQRHQTLRAAIDWSFNLLDEPLRALLCRTAVFAGGFFIESAEAVCGDDVGIDVFEGLSSLVDKSLLTRRDVDGEPRLGALETIREYALDRLRQTPDEAALRERHASHFAELVEELSPGTMGRDFRRCAGRLFTETDNIRAALTWALEQPSQAMTARILRPALWFWATHGRFDEGRAWALRALSATDDRPKTAERGVALEVASWLSLLLGDMSAVVAYGTEGVALWAALGRDGESARTKVPLGLAMAATGQHDAAVRIEEEACATSRARRDSFGAALALNMLGELARASGDYEGARVHNEEAIALLRGAGNITTSSLLAINLAFCYLHAGDVSAAARAVIPTLELALEFKNLYNIGLYLAIMACVAALRGRHADALRLFGASGKMMKTLGAAVQPADQAEFDHYSAIARAALGDAEADAALAEGGLSSSERAIEATISLRA